MAEHSHYIRYSNIYYHLLPLRLRLEGRNIIRFKEQNAIFPVSQNINLTRGGRTKMPANSFLIVISHNLYIYIYIFGLVLKQGPSKYQVEHE